MSEIPGAILMCAICGVVNKNKTPVNKDLLQDMSRTMRHRGPDDEGFRLFPYVGFGFQRLSIIDLAGGHQPMSNEDDSLWIVFNGEIYNFLELREELERTGRHRFKTRSDTELILHLYEEMGERCVERLRGMFAFAVWDAKNETLFIGRDRLGKKPLVYANLPGVFLFSSEIKALLEHPAISKDIDYAAIDMYLSYQYIPSPRTIFKSIRKLPPAHTLTLRNGNVEIKRYWTPPFLPKTKMTFHEAQEAMMMKLKEATRLRMISDVPLGAFLSGGKDSSVVVGLMSELSSKPIQTFSIGFEEADFSELPYAREVAQHFHCDHHEFVVKANMVEVLPKLAWHYGEPYADSSALPSFSVAQQSRKYVTVTLNGDGGDETMAGYPRYRAMRAMRWLQKSPRVLRQLALHSVKQVPDGVPPRSLSWRVKRLLGLGLEDPRTTYLDTLCFFYEHQKKGLYTSFLEEETKDIFPPDYVNALIDESASKEDIDPYLYADLISYLPECLMTKMDIASMANSLETRSPFLDHEFVELVGGFPSVWKLSHRWQSKAILTDKIKGWMPETVLRRRKQGFALPMAHWFRGPVRQYLSEMLLSEKAIRRDLFRKEAIMRLLDEHQSGKTDNSYQLWALLMLEQWFQVVVD
jgi:asparagine synthase (glutamine-hydrolysing)